MAKVNRKKITFKKNKSNKKERVYFRKTKKSIKKNIKKTDITKELVLKKIPKNTKNTKEDLDKFSAETLFKPRIKVIGIGGGGGSIVSEIGRSLKKATFVIADTDIRALKKRPGIKYLWFGENLTHGLGTGLNIDLAKQAAEEAREKIVDFFKDQDIIIFIASLGGGVGSGATQVFTKAAQKFGGITFGIFTLPFRFEGKNKARIAQNALKCLRQSLNVSLIIPNERIFKAISADTPIVKAFSIINKTLIELLESLIDLIYSPGIINIDFADIRTILKDKGNSVFLNTVEESGKDRADKICKKIIANPLLHSSNFVPEKILFDISGSENLSMFEVEKISKYIGEQNPKAKIIFGISKNSKLKNKIKTTILMIGGGVKTEAPIKINKIIPVKKTVKEIPVSSKKIEEKTEKKLIRIKKQKSKKSSQKSKENAQTTEKGKEKEFISEHPLGLPVLETPVAVSLETSQKKMNITETITLPVKKAIRRTGLDIKKAEELEQKRRIAQEKEWEIPTFLRKVKFNK